VYHHDNPIDSIKFEEGVSYLKSSPTNFAHTTPHSPTISVFGLKANTTKDVTIPLVSPASHSISVSLSEPNQTNLNRKKARLNELYSTAGEALKNDAAGKKKGKSPFGDLDYSSSNTTDEESELTWLKRDYAAAAGYKINSDCHVLLSDYEPTIDPASGDITAPKRPLSALLSPIITSYVHFLYKKLLFLPSSIELNQNCQSRNVNIGKRMVRLVLQNLHGRLLNDGRV
jgi:hypothetical protein